MLGTPSIPPGAEERGTVPPHRGIPHPGSTAAMLHRPNEWNSARGVFEIARWGARLVLAGVGELLASPQSSEQPQE